MLFELSDERSAFDEMSSDVMNPESLVKSEVFVGTMFDISDVVANVPFVPGKFNSTFAPLGGNNFALPQSSMANSNP